MNGFRVSYIYINILWCHESEDWSIVEMRLSFISEEPASSRVATESGFTPINREIVENTPEMGLEDDPKDVHGINWESD